MSHDGFTNLPEDAQEAYRRAIRHFLRKYPDCADVVPLWSDVARRMWVDQMASARPDVTGWHRAKGLVVGSRAIVWLVASRWFVPTAGRPVAFGTGHE